jgi:hypothetical protein
MPYVPFPIETDPDAFLQRSFEYLQNTVEGWSPNEGNLDVLLLAAISRIAGSLRDLIADVPDTIFMRFGTDLLNLPPKDAAPAAGEVRFTVKDAVGYTIPAGTTYGVRDDSGVSHAFETGVDLVIPNGEIMGVTTGIAVVPGVDANGLFFHYTFMIDSVLGVSMVELASSTSGGADVETNDEYMMRLSHRLSLMTPTPILADDYALLALDVPGVGRSMGIDLLNPATGTFNNERYVTVAVTDVDGVALTALAMQEVEDYLRSFREVNFVVEVIGPTYTMLNIIVEVVNVKGADPGLLALNVRDSIERYISPATWGSPARIGGDPSFTWNWSRETKLRFFELAAVADQVDGVDYVVDVTINGNVNTDATLTGYAPLPHPDSTVSVVVTAP